MAELPSADPEIREKIEGLAAEHGWPMLHQTLTEVDPITAARLEPNDAQRINRALEVYYTTGITFSELLKAQAAKPLPFTAINIGLMPEDDQRARLHHNIEQRFDAMLAQGLIDEVQGLMQQEDFDLKLPAFKSVGYRQVIEFLNDEIDKDSLVEKGYAATRQLAKRQLTWLRKWDPLIRVNCFDDALVQAVLQLSLIHI